MRNVFAQLFITHLYRSAPTLLQSTHANVLCLAKSSSSERLRRHRHRAHLRTHAHVCEFRNKNDANTIQINRVFDAGSGGRQQLNQLRYSFRIIAPASECDKRLLRAFVPPKKKNRCKRCHTPPSPPPPQNEVASAQRFASNLYLFSYSNLSSKIKYLRSIRDSREFHVVVVTIVDTRFAMKRIDSQGIASEQRSDTDSDCDFVVISFSSSHTLDRCAAQRLM